MFATPNRLQVLSAGVFSLILNIGIARFAYTPLLPLMQQQAGLGVAAAGWLAAINYAGYLSGALVAMLVGDLWLKDRLYRLGLLLGIVSTAMMGWTTDALVWGVSRYLAGLSSAASMLLGAGLVLHWLIRHGKRPELGVHYSGIGFGIVVCSAAVALLEPLTWDVQWLALAAFGVLLAIPAWLWLPAPERQSSHGNSAQFNDNPPSPAFLKVFMAAYFCAGIGYVVSATFIVAIVEHLPGLQGQGKWAFLAIGMAAAPASMVWDLVTRRFGDLQALMAAAVLQIVGILLPVLHHSLWTTLAGAGLFGGTFVGMVSLVLTMAGRYYPGRPAKMMGRMTLAYGSAQIVGPAMTGWLASRLGSYAAGLYLAAAVMVVGTGLLVVLLGIRRRETKSGA